MTGASGQPVATVPLRGERDIAVARIAVSRALDGLGAGTLAKVRFVTAVSEIVRNAVMHGGGGEIAIFAENRPRTIRVRCTDQGPGISDVERALQDGFSTARSMGKGLGGARRLVDRFDLRSTPGQGTTVEMTTKL